jgi:predicted RNA-binding Zn-ribbon protein involved in translation (DUF1610 family)
MASAIPSSGSRFCVSCGRNIAWDANVCPYCGHDYRIPMAAQQGAAPIGEGLKIVLYILSLLFWMVGIIVGVVFYTRPDPDSRHVGKVCIILGCVSIVLSIALTFLLYVIILSWP